MKKAGTMDFSSRYARLESEVSGKRMTSQTERLHLLATKARSRTRAETVEGLVLGCAVRADPTVGLEGFRVGKYVRVAVHAVVLDADDCLRRLSMAERLHGWDTYVFGNSSAEDNKVVLYCVAGLDAGDGGIFPEGFHDDGVGIGELIDGDKVGDLGWVREGLPHFGCEL
jgi:hypothetical protein